jgi:tetratricopeptide (TPR) repeat protein
MKKCWEGYERVPGTKPGEKGSCRKKSQTKVGSDFNSDEMEMIKKMKEYQAQGKTLITNMKPSVFKQKLPNLYKVIDKGLLKFTGAVKLVNKVANSKLQDYRKALELLSQLEKLDGMQDEYSEKIQNAYDNPNSAKSALEKLIKSLTKEIEKKKKKASQPSYEEWLKQKNELQDEVDKTSEALNKITGKGGGLTPDSIKNTPEYKKAKKDYNDAFEKLRTFNGKSPAEYMKRKRRGSTHIAKNPTLTISIKEPKAKEIIAISEKANLDWSMSGKNMQFSSDGSKAQNEAIVKIMEIATDYSLR